MPSRFRRARTSSNTAIGPRVSSRHARQATPRRCDHGRDNGSRPSESTSTTRDASGARARGDSRRFTPEQVDREVEQIEKDARSSRLVGTDGDVSCTLADAQLFLARLHDFASWPKFVAHIEALSSDNSSDSEFERAADAVVTGDIAALSAMLRKNPELVRARSARDHRATLLHYTAANGHEGYRQTTPKNAVDVARLLLEAGSEPDALAHMYGHEVTTMEMLVSSAHPAIAGLQVALVDALVDHGANPSGVDDNGSPLMTAFRFHYPHAADALVRRGARIDNVISAAALGRTDLLDDWVVDGTTLAENVMLAKGPWPRLRADPKSSPRLRAHVGRNVGQGRRGEAAARERRRSVREG